MLREVSVLEVPVSPASSNPCHVFGSIFGPANESKMTPAWLGAGAKMRARPVSTLRARVRRFIDASLLSSDRQSLRLDVCNRAGHLGPTTVGRRGRQSGSRFEHRFRLRRPVAHAQSGHPTVTPPGAKH